MKNKRQSVFMQMHNGTRTGEGSFNVALKDIFYTADNSNRQKLVAAFPEFFGEEVPEFGIVKQASAGVRSRQWERVDKMDELEGAFTALQEAEQWLIREECPEFDGYDPSEGFFQWIHLPRLQRYLSETGRTQVPCASDPYMQRPMAVLLNILYKKLPTEGLSLSGLTASRNHRANTVCFCISGEISADDLQTSPGCRHEIDSETE